MRAGRTSRWLPAERGFPADGGGRHADRFALAAAELRTLIDRARFAISTEETRYYLNGIYLHAARPATCRCCARSATDGHRLARVEMPLPEGAADMPGVIVPRKTVGEVRKLLET